MALTADKPNVWAARMEPYLDTLSVYKQALTNNRYEGKVEYNQTLKIVSVSDVSESAYSGAWDAGDWGEPATTSIDFTVSQARKFLLSVQDLDQEGSILNLIDSGSQRAAYAIINRQDQYIASLYSEIAAANAYGDDTAPISVGFGGADVSPVNALVMLRQELASANAPLTSPRVVIPIWYATMLVQEIGARNTNMGDAAINGSVAAGQGLIANNVAGFAQIWASANTPNTSGEKYKVLAGDPEITFASKISKVETARAENDFATRVKGLYVYGGKIPYGEFMALGTFNQGTFKQDA